MPRCPRMPALALGLVLALAQTLAVCVASAAPTAYQAYGRLVQFDSNFYIHIATHGYRSTLPPVPGNKDLANVAFFPGLPLLARSTHAVLHVPINVALLLVAQIACWGFWTHVLLLCQRWQASRLTPLAACAAILLHPAAFFLVAGYSESLFLFGLLGFLYWSDEPGLLGGLLAAIHGLVMTTTRIVGLPLALYPLVRLWMERQGRGERSVRTIGRAVAEWLVALAGALGFFVYCQVRFGTWDLYMQSQSALWGLHVDYLTLFRPETYALCLRAFEAGRLGPNDLSRLSVPLTLLTLLCFLVFEWRQVCRTGDTGWRSRLWYYVAAGVMFYLSVCGLKDRAMASMLRYTLPVAVMLVLAAVHAQCHRQSSARSLRWPVALSILLAALALALLQLKLAYQFTHGSWVA